MLSNTNGLSDADGEGILSLQRIDTTGLRIRHVDAKDQVVALSIRAPEQALVCGDVPAQVPHIRFLARSAFTSAPLYYQGR